MQMNRSGYLGYRVESRIRLEYCHMALPDSCRQRFRIAWQFVANRTLGAVQLRTRRNSRVFALIAPYAVPFGVISSAMTTLVKPWALPANDVGWCRCLWLN